MVPLAAMFQLNLKLLGRHLRELQPREKSAPQSHQHLAWKHGLSVHIVQQPRAKRYLLRLQPDGTVRLVIPRRGTRVEALRFLERSEAWLLKRRLLWQETSRIRSPWLHGTSFLFRGHEVILNVEEGTSARLSFDSEALTLSGKLPDYREAIQAYLRQLAERELPPRTRELAEIHNVTVHRVTVRDQKTRWGSCSARKTISLNWRLIQAPPSVLDYLIIHELMHLREMNHSARYWKLVAEAYPGYREAERWLKRGGLSLRD